MGKKLLIDFGLRNGEFYYEIDILPKNENLWIRYSGILQWEFDTNSFCEVYNKIQDEIQFLFYAEKNKTQLKFKLLSIRGIKYDRIHLSVSKVEDSVENRPFIVKNLENPFEFFIEFDLLNFKKIVLDNQIFEITDFPFWIEPEGFVKFERFRDEHNNYLNNCLIKVNYDI